MTTVAEQVREATELREVTLAEIQAGVPQQESSANREYNLWDHFVAISVTMKKVGIRRKTEINSDFVAAVDKDLFKHYKEILKSAELKAIESHDGKTRNRVKKYVQESNFRDGIYLVANHKLPELMDELTKRKDDRAKLVQAFVDAYPRMIEDAKVRLGTYFNAADYPSQEQIGSFFDLTWNIFSYGVPENNLRRIRDDIYQTEIEKGRQQLIDARQSIILAERQVLLNHLSHLMDKLTPDDEGRKKIFRDKSVTKITSFLDEFTLHNVTQDGELERIVGRIKDTLNGVSPDDLRSDDGIRKKVMEAFAPLKNELENLATEERSGRRYSFLSASD